MDDTD